MITKNVEFNFKMQITGTMGAIETAKNHLKREIKKILEKPPYFADWTIMQELKEK